jgi:hypothetical protein
LTDDFRATVVAAGLTVTAAAAEALSAKPVVPEKEAVSAWVPMPSDTGMLARPAASSGAESSNVLPSRKETVPIGVPAREVTVAVSVSICPKTAVAVDVLSVVVVAALATRRGAVQQHTDVAGGGVGRDQVHEAVAVQIGRSHAEGVIAPGQDVVLSVAGDGVALGAAVDVLDRVVRREGQGQPRVDHLCRRVAEVDGHGAGGGVREVEHVVPAAAGLVDRVAAQGVVRVEDVGVVIRPADERVVARPAVDQSVVAGADGAPGRSKKRRKPPRREVPSRHVVRPEGFRPRDSPRSSFVVELAVRVGISDEPGRSPGCGALDP